jgi:hypothetical protein
MPKKSGSESKKCYLHRISTIPYSPFHCFFIVLIASYPIEITPTNITLNHWTTLSRHSELMRKPAYEKDIEESTFSPSAGSCSRVAAPTSMGKCVYTIPNLHD